jgi:hypothetical protein
MSDDRSERLREKRQQAKEKAEAAVEESEKSEASKPDKPSEPDNQSQTDDASESDEQESVKEIRDGTYFYLPSEQKREIQRLYNVMKADYEFEFDEDFEKNRHFAPLLIQYGLDGLENLDAQEVRERLESQNVL